jgi:hypothetical protein
MIERLHPGVYVIELPFEAKPIDGVATPSLPDWTDDNVHDPGVTLLSLLVYTLDAPLHRAHPGVTGAAAGMDRRTALAHPARLHVQAEPGAGPAGPGRSAAYSFSSMPSTSAAMPCWGRTAMRRRGRRRMRWWASRRSSA